MIGLRQPWQYYNRPWAVHTVGRRWALNVIITLGQYAWLYCIGCEMLSSPLERIPYLTMLGVTCYHRPWTSHTIGRCRAWHAHMSLRKQTWLDGIRRGMPLSPLDNIHGGTRLRAMPSSPLGSTRGRMMSGATCHLCPWTTHTVELLRFGIP